MHIDISDIAEENHQSVIFYIIIRTRRNRNSHFFFPNQSPVEISEVEMLYLPLLNRLEEVYRR